MPLKMTLEPQEWLMVGETKVVNVHPIQANFEIEGAAPVLRQIHTISEASADTPAKRAYFAVQQLYLGFAKSFDAYFAAAGELLTQAPSSGEIIAKANQQIEKGSFYGALRVYRTLLS